VSTRDLPTEYATLTPVPRENYHKGHHQNGLGLCDVDPSHGAGTEFWQTPDHRAIVVCHGCGHAIRREREQGQRGNAAHA
jgi:hypothetical protein